MGQQRDLSHRQTTYNCRWNTERNTYTPSVFARWGLNYLSLNRSSQSLSGGESQRIRLATQIGSQLVNVLYILMKPSIGLHQRDNERLIKSLKQLRDIGNSSDCCGAWQGHDAGSRLCGGHGSLRRTIGRRSCFFGNTDEMMQADTLTGLSER